jgi:acyl-CoA synthetase (AMP-forming)/AMP-acid ligase II/acyl carrier protein
VQAGVESVVMEVAIAKNIPILELNQKEDMPDGLFMLSGKTHPSPWNPGLAHQGDIALILHTSGTTARPKQVPLTHKNLVTSADNISSTLGLTPNDRCLNIMPLFHIHGLIAAVLASMKAGASTFCSPGFYATEFFKWMEMCHPTWYTAVPTMHQSILMRAAANEEIIQSNPLRFIRSSSASLPPVVMEELEKTFHTPVIEAYGMTEASHQMASNPLPPLQRKVGSAGFPAGPEIAIMAENGVAFLPDGYPGEIVIRGPNVTLGYAHNPEANQKSFTNGWFRTGDQGYLDEDGYLFITGRLKEIINRGAEKISPREIDEVFLGHPAVTQAVTFAVPDEILGEDVAIALVLNDKNVTESDLRQYAASLLALHKVPRQVIILDEIPKGATGKVQRIGLAAKLGLVKEKETAASQPIVFVAPSTEPEKKLAAIWCSVLDIPKVGLDDRFKDLGGDSMLATLLHVQINDKFNVDVPLVDLYSAPTLKAQVELVENLLGNKKKKLER